MNHIVLCLGMHRSGTSLIAKSLECLGVELGDRADWKGDDNPKNFAEHQDVLTIDEAILQRIGQTWDDPEPYRGLAFACVDDPHIARIRQVATGLLLYELKAHPLFGIKEPRLCRLMDFWRPVLNNIGCKVSVVHAIRHPMAVAASLARRNGLPIDIGLYLWQEYNFRARSDVNPTWTNTTVLYDAMMALPMQQIERMGAALGLTVSEQATKEFARNFVDDTLWHEVAEDDRNLPLEINTVWQTLRAEAMR